MTSDGLIGAYQANVERSLRGSLLDAEVDRLLDDQEQLVRLLRAEVAPRHVREINTAPWIVVAP